MPVDPQVLAQARAYIGKAGPSRRVEVTRKDIVRFAIAIGDKNPLWRDDDYARQAGYAGVIAPPMFHAAQNLGEEDLDELAPSGLGKMMGPRMEVPAPGFPGAVAGGREIEFGEPVRPGDTITVEARVVDVYEKEGRRGPMLFVTDETTFINQRGQVAVRERNTVIRHQ